MQLGNSLSMSVTASILASGWAPCFVTPPAGQASSSELSYRINDSVSGQLPRRIHYRNPIIPGRVE